MGGRYRPGQKFPSEAALVRRFGASRLTVGHALREVQQGGFVDRVAGSGTYVRSIAQRREGLLFGLIIPNLGETLDDVAGHRFSFYVVSAAPQAVIQSALEGIVPNDHIFGTEFRYDPATGEIQSILRVPAGYGKVAVLDDL